jgi:hypothetical protein
MTMLATKVKLAVGAPATVITVTECVEVEGNYGPQARITGTDERCGLNLTSAVGQMLAFWKEEAQNKAGQTFPALRIDTMGEALTKKAPAPKPASATAKQPTSLGAAMPFDEVETGAAPVAKAVPIVPQTNGPEALTVLTARYSACLQAARGIAVAQKVDALTGDIAGAVTAIAATLFIQLSRQTER